MHLLSSEQCHNVSGAKLKHDVAAYSLGVAGLTMVMSGLAMEAAAVTCGNKTLAKAGAMQLCLGIATLTVVVACEYSGITELCGWYQCYQDYKSWKNYLVG